MNEFEERKDMATENRPELQGQQPDRIEQSVKAAEVQPDLKADETKQEGSISESIPAQAEARAKAINASSGRQTSYSWIPGSGQTAQQTGQTAQQAGQTAQQNGQPGQPYGQPGQYSRTGQPGQQPYGQAYRQNGTGYQQQTAWSSQPHYNYYQRQQQNAQQNGNRKKAAGSRWATAVAMALVFGLIAGTATFGVNRAANYFFPINTQSEASAVPEEEEKVHLSVSASGTAETLGKVQAPAYIEEKGTVAAVAHDAMPSLVTISTMSVQEMQSFFGTQRFEAQGAGTGVIVGENDTELLIATNNHVVDNAEEVSIGFIDEEVVKAQIKGTDSSSDLAIVAVKKEEIPDDTMDQIKIATIGDSDDLVLGEQVVAIGNALGVGQSVTSGYVSAFNRELDLSDGFNQFVSSGLIQTDAAINSGNSGGALLNMKGELIGINEAKSAYTSSGVTVDNVGYAIPMSKAQPILEELMNQTTREKYSEEEQGYLGVSLVNVSSEFANLYGTPQGVGFAEVAEDSPAAEAGAMRGDILTDFNGKTVTNVDDVLNEIQYYRSGEEVELTVLRADNGEYKELTLTVTLGTKEAISSLETQTQ